MNYNLLNGSNLSYIGDAYYELEIRKYLISKNITKNKELIEMSIKFVSATAHAYIFENIKDELTEENKMALGFPQEDFTSDKYRLCEYIHVHAGDGFILCFDESSEVFAIAQRDPQVAPINNLFMRYSGAYFSQCGKSPKNIFTDMPTEIYLCRIEISAEKEIQLTPIKTKLIFSGGKFVGPTLFEEGVLY